MHSLAAAKRSEMPSGGLLRFQESTVCGTCLHHRSVNGSSHADQHPLARRSGIAVGQLAGDGKDGEIGRWHSGPQSDVVWLVESADGDEHAARVLQPSLVKAAVGQPRQPCGTQVHPPSRRSLRQSRFPGGARAEGGASQCRSEPLRRRPGSHNNEECGGDGGGGDQAGDGG